MKFLTKAEYERRNRRPRLVKRRNKALQPSDHPVGQEPKIREIPENRPNEINSLQNGIGTENPKTASCQPAKADIRCPRCGTPKPHPCSCYFPPVNPPSPPPPDPPPFTDPRLRQINGDPFSRSKEEILRNEAAFARYDSEQADERTNLINRIEANRQAERNRQAELISRPRHRF